MSMDKLIQWLKDSEKYEFCRSYGVPDIPDMEFIHRQEDFYISMLSVLHSVLVRYMSGEKSDALKATMLHIAKGLLVYSQKETTDSFYGVRLQNNQLYVASIYYLCEYPAVAAWVMGDIEYEEYEQETAQILALTITGYKTYPKIDLRKNDFPLQEYVGRFVLTGDEGVINSLADLIEHKYSTRDFESPTDFYMTTVLLCVLRKFMESNIWNTLRTIDATFDWFGYVRHSFNQHVFSFLPSQQDAINKGLINFSGSFSLKMPTSAGKSYITELLIYHELHSNPKAKVLYLAPLRALSRELRDRFKRIHRPLGFTYATKYGGSAPSVSENKIVDAQLLIATPESFMAIESSDEELLSGFTLVICDEGQLLDDYSRGINYELLLTRLRKRDNIRFLFISAIIPNISVINKWLKGTDECIGDSTYRPSKLTLGVALVKDDEIELNVYNESYSDILYSIPKYVTKADAQEEELRHFAGKKWKIYTNPVCCSLALRALHAGAVLLFSTSKSTGASCVSLAKYLISMIDNDSFDAPSNYVKDQNQLHKITEYISYQLGDDHQLPICLKYGFAYHHGDIPQNIREKIEQTYDKGVFRLVVSSTTLAEGVNLPIKTLVIANAIDPSNIGYFLPNTRLKNIIGRVGRAGRERYGTVIVPTTSNRNMLLKLVKEALDTDDSQLDKMKGTLFDLIVYLQRKQLLDNPDNVNQLLSATTFSDAIDEMIIRSTDGNIEQLDIERLVSESLAYTLSDEVKRNALKQVFSIRHNALKESYADEKYKIMRATGLNARELDYLEHNVTDDDIVLVNKTDKVDDDKLVALLIDKTFALPTVVDDINLGPKSRFALFSDHNRVKVISILWMQGYQYHEIAKHVGLDVDTAILIINYLQSVVHDKGSSIIAYLIETKDLSNKSIKYWPEYLRLGINTRLMYELHNLRIPERIQLHAIQRYIESIGVIDVNIDFLEFMIVQDEDEILSYMAHNGYPILLIENLKEIFDYIKLNE